MQFGEEVFRFVRLTSTLRSNDDGSRVNSIDCVSLNELEPRLTHTQAYFLHS